LGDRDGGIVRPRIKDDHVAPQTVVRLDNGVTQTEFEAQFRSYFPGILGEPLEHVATIGGERPDADLRIRGEQAQGGGRHIQARPPGAVIAELKTPVLVVGPARNARYVDLIKVVLTRSLEEGAELEGVVPMDFRYVVREIINRAGGTGRIR